MKDIGGPTLLDYTSGTVQEMLDYLSEVAKRLRPMSFRPEAPAVPPYVPMRVQATESGAAQEEWEALRERVRRAVILGSPGTGKTTLLRVEGYRRAQEEASMLRAGRHGTAAAVLPVFVPLKALAEEEGELEDAVVTFLQRHYLRGIQWHGEQHTHEFSHHFWTVLRERLRAGRCVLLLDALDEVEPENKREALRQRLLRFAANYACPFLLTSRLVGYKELDFPISGGGPEWELAPFNHDQVQTLIAQWFATHQEVARQFLQEVAHHPYIQRLAQVPLLATLICQAFGDGKLQRPISPEELYRQCIHGLWRIWQKKHWTSTLPEDTRYEMLDYLARRFFPQSELPKAALHSALREFLRTTNHLRDRSHEDVLKELSDAGILVQRRGGDIEPYHFLHPMFAVDSDRGLSHPPRSRSDRVETEDVTPDGAIRPRMSRVPRGMVRVEIENRVIDVATVHVPSLRAQVIDYLIPLVSETSQRQPDHTKRYWIYIALGEFGAQAESAAARGKAAAAVQQGLRDDDEHARRGAVEAWRDLGS